MWDIKTSEDQLIRKTESNHQISIQKGKKKKEKKWNEIKKKNYLEKKVLCELPPQEHIKAGYTKWHVLSVNLLKGVQTMHHYSYIHFFLRSVISMADRYGIKEIRISPLSPTHRKLIQHLPLLSQNTHNVINQTAWLRTTSIHVRSVLVVSLPS